MLSSLTEALADSRLPEAPCVEPAVNLPVYVTSISKAAVKYGALHLAFFVELDGPNGVEHVINLRTTMQATAWRGIAQKLDEASFPSGCFFVKR
jgi:hypothetical protein